MTHLPAAVRLLSLWRDPPDWIVWARPTRDGELGPDVDLVLTIDVGEDTEARRDYGVCDIGVGVRWYDERRTTDVATCGGICAAERRAMGTRASVGSP